MRAPGTFRAPSPLAARPVTASPHSPPMPAASGHLAGAAGADRAADSSSTPATAQKILNGVGCRRC